MAFEKTDQLVAELNSHHLGGNLKVRFTGHNNTQIVFFTDSLELAQSLIVGIKKLSKEKIDKIDPYTLQDPTGKQLGYTFAVPSTLVEQICKDLKLDYGLLKKELAAKEQFQDIPSEKLSMKR